MSNNNNNNKREREDENGDDHPQNHAKLMAQVPGTPQIKDEERLLFAVPKKGRLYEQCCDLLKGAGIAYNRSARLDIALCTTLPIKLVFLNAKDIAQFVAEGNIDVGITGQDMVFESECELKVKEILKTGFGKCRLSVLAPQTSDIKEPSHLLNKRIVTSFPLLTQKFYEKIASQTGDLKNVPSIRYISGSVEAACGLGLSEGVVDLIETGGTAQAAGLVEVGTIMSTEAVLITNPKAKHPDLVELLRKRIEGYLFAKKYCMVYYNIPRAQLELASKISPGRRAPTVTALDDPTWCSVGAMVPSNDISTVMDRLQEIGAHDIMVLDIVNCRS